MIGKHIINFDVIDSTNDYIKNNISKLDDGVVVTANSQTKGRGRRENTWQSQVGNLYFSFLVKQKVLRENIFFFNMLTAVTIVKVLEKYQIKSTIKYPNDIVVGNKKIAGILMETSGFKALDSIVIGVGINVNQEDFVELNYKATSIMLVTKKVFSTKDLLNDFITEYNHLSSEKNIYKLYLDYSTIIGKAIIYKNKKYQIVNIFSNGNLKLKNEQTSVNVSYNDISLTELYSNNA